MYGSPRPAIAGRPRQRGPDPGQKGQRGHGYNRTVGGHQPANFPATSSKFLCIEGEDGNNDPKAKQVDKDD